jgi:flagellin
MLLLRSNQISKNLYGFYLKNINNLEASARRLATGKKLTTLEDGGGEVGVADLFKHKITVNNTLLTGLTTAEGFLTVQGEALDQANEILDVMSTLAGEALDTTLTTADRISLDVEFQALESEFSSLFPRKFNAISLFGALTVRTQIDPNATVTVPALTLTLLTFTTMTLSQLASASAALISLKSRVSSLNIFKAKSGAAAAQIDRVIEFVQSVSTNLGNSEDAIRNLDLAVETGNFTQQQVILASAQSVLSQSNNLIQSLLTFLS